MIAVLVLVAVYLIVSQTSGPPVAPPAAGDNTSQAAPQVMAAVRAQAAIDSKIDEKDVVILEVQAANWPDSCLGLATDDEICAQVITSGYRITVNVQGGQIIYRTNQDGSVLWKE